MHVAFRPRVFVAPALATLVLAPAVQGQESLKNIVQSDRSIERRMQQRRSAAPEEPTGMQLGPVQVDLRGGLDVEWTDNVRNSGENIVEDVIFTPSIGIDAVWPIKDNSVLGIGFGIGYDFYLDDSDSNGASIAPDSEIGFTASVGDVVINVADKISYLQEVISEGELTGVSNAPRLENVASARASWLPDRWLLEGGVGYQTYLVFEDQYSYLDRGSLQTFARGGYFFGERTQVGVEVAPSLTDYYEATRRDFFSYSAGPYVDWTPIYSMRVILRGGFVQYQFDEVSGVVADDSVDTFYVQGSVQHRLTDFISHSVSGSHELQPGFLTELLERSVIRYSIRWRMMDPVEISAGVFYELGEEAVESTNEDYDRVGGNIGVAVNLTERLRATAGYRYINRSSDVAARDYHRNSATFGISYQY